MFCNYCKKEVEKNEEGDCIICGFSFPNGLQIELKPLFEGQLLVKVNGVPKYKAKIKEERVIRYKWELHDLETNPDKISPGHGPVTAKGFTHKDLAETNLIEFIKEANSDKPITWMA